MKRLLNYLLGDGDSSGYSALHIDDVSNALSVYSRWKGAFDNTAVYEDDRAVNIDEAIGILEGLGQVGAVNEIGLQILNNLKAGKEVIGLIQSLAPVTETNE